MIQATIILEELVLSTHYIEDHFEAILVDTVTGRHTKLTLRPDEMGAIAALALGGEEGELAKISEQLYALAEPRVNHLNNEFRPIP